MHVGVCRLTLLASHCHSLKEKRAVLRKLKDRVEAHYRVRLGEVGGQDTWQRVVLGFAVVGSERQGVEALLDEIVRFVNRTGLAQVMSDEREVLSYGEAPFGESARAVIQKTGGHALPGGAGDEPEDDEWIPEEWKSEEVR